MARSNSGLDFNTNVTLGPSVGDALVSGSNTINKGIDTGLDRQKMFVDMARQQVADQRAKELFDRQTNEYNREVAGRQALQDYAAQPVQTDTMIDSQRKLMDEAVTDRVNKLGRAFTPEEATRIQKAYESITPFREDVETKIEKDLIAKNVDPLKAKQYAQMEGAKYQSIPEYQQFLNTQAEKATANEQNRFKDTLELEKFKREAYKDELDKYKTKMEMLYKGMGAAGGTTSGGTGGIIGGQDKSKAYEKAYTKAGNEEELAKRLDAAFTKYGARAVNNALAASGIDEPVRLLEWDAGRRDVSLDRFDKALANEKPLSEIQGQFNSGIPEAPMYGLPGVARVYTPESARSVAQTSAKDRLMQVLGAGETTPEATTSNSTSIGGLNLGKSVTVSTPVKGVPNSLVANEGAKVDSNGNYVLSEDVDSKGNKQGQVIGYGYNLKQHKDDIATDFKAAGIPQYKIDAAMNGAEFSLNKDENDRLTGVIYPKYGTNKAENIIGKDAYRKLDPMTKEIAADMAYRGDLVPGEKSYRGDLVNAIRGGDVNSVYNYVTSMPVPREVKDRLSNILTTQRGRNEVLGDTQPGGKPALVDAQRELIKEGKVDSVLSGMKRQLDREDWSGAQDTASEEDKRNASKGIALPELKGNSEAQRLVRSYVKSGGSGMIADHDLAVRLQRNANMTRKEAEDTVKKLKMELNPKINLEREDLLTD